MLLQEGALHIWFLNLNSLQKSTQELTSYLTYDELKRHDRYVFDTHRMQFAKRRYLLKRVLALYLKADATEVRLSRHARGKPYLNREGFDVNIMFNTSCSGECVVIAITKNIPVGVDVEQIKTITDIDAVSKTFMSEAEYRKFCRTDSQGKVRLFYQLWTRKESAVKAAGTGLSYPIRELDFSDLDKSTILLEEDRNRVRKWYVHDIELCNTLACAVTTKKDIEQLIIRSSGEMVEGLY